VQTEFTLPKKAPKKLIHSVGRLWLEICSWTGHALAQFINCPPPPADFPNKDKMIERTGREQCRAFLHKNKRCCFVAVGVISISLSAHLLINLFVYYVCFDAPPND
jgi:hypothetical protein